METGISVVLLAYREADNLRVVFNYLERPSLTSGRTAESVRVEFDSESLLCPATVVLKSTAGVKCNVVLRNCHLELATPSESGQHPGFYYAASVRQGGASYSSRLTVPAGVKAYIPVLNNVVGRLVKDGEGTLEVGLPNSYSPTGTIANSGVLSVTNGTLRIKTLTIGEGATLCATYTGESPATSCSHPIEVTSSLTLPTGKLGLRVDYAAACSLLVRMEAVKALGFWEDVFIHFDDIEWGVRATWAGWHNYATTSSTVVHPEFDPKKAGAWVCYFDARNQYWFASKFGPLHVAVARLKNWAKDVRARLTGELIEGNACRALAWRDYKAGIRHARTEVIEALKGGVS